MAVFGLIEKVSNIIRTELRRVSGDLNLQPVHLSAIFYLYRCNSFSDTPSALTSYLGITKGSVSQTLAVLHRHELIIKMVDPTDQRVIHLSLSEKGLQIISKLTAAPIFGTILRDTESGQSNTLEEELRRLLVRLHSTKTFQMFGSCHNCRHFTDSEECTVFKATVPEHQRHKICVEHELELGPLSSTTSINLS